MMLQKEKQALRKELLNQRNNLKIDVLSFADESIFNRVTSFSLYQTADSVFIYLSTQKEPDTKQLIDHALKSNKTVYIPKCTGQHEMIAVRFKSDETLRQNQFGIQEPIRCDEVADPEKIDLIVIPCISANRSGARLGHGGGYYDNYLKKSKGVRLCLCYDTFVRERIPMDDNDEYIDYLITESKTVKCR